MIDPLTTLARLAIESHRELVELEELVDAAKERRAILFAKANQAGYSSGDIARFLPPSVLPHHVHPVIRVGRGLLACHERQAARRAERMVG